METRTQNSRPFFILFSGTILGFIAFNRIGLHPFVDLFDYVKIFSFSVCCILLPNFICEKFAITKKIAFGNSAVLGFVLVFFSYIGLLFKNFVEVENLIIVLALTLLIFELNKVNYFQIIKNLPFYIIIIPALVLLYYNNEDSQNPLAYEAIALGEIHIDNLFHISLLNMFDTYRVPTLGLDGIQFLKYHWGSHVMFAGFKNLLHIDSISVYNVFYPCVFIPLFMKGLYDLSNEISNKIFKRNISNETQIVFIVFLFGIISTAYFQLFWLIGESNVVSTIFAFGLIELLLGRVNSEKPITYGLIIISFLFLLAMSISKISIGVPLSITLVYMLIRHSKSKRLIGFSISLIVLLFVIVKFYTLAETQTPFFGIKFLSYKHFLLDLFKANSLFWGFSNGFSHYTIGISLFLVALVVIKKNRNAENSLHKYKQFLFFEALAFLNLISILCAFYSTGLNGSMNSFYFCFLQLMLSLCVILAFIGSNFYGWINLKYQRGFLFSILFVFVVSTKGFISNYHGSFRDITFYHNFKKSFVVSGAETNKLYSLIKYFHNLEPNSKSIVYVDHNEKWLYDSQKFRPFAQAFLVQSITGMCGIATISQEQLLNPNYETFLNLYKKKLKNPAPSLDLAKLQAKEWGFNSLTNISFKSDTLIIDSIKL